MTTTTSTPATTKAYLTIATTSPSQTTNSPNQTIGTLTLHVYSKTTPRTAANFLHLLTSKKGYIGTPFHRLIPKFMIQGGDTTKGDGTGGKSLLYDDSHDGSGSFADENFRVGHTRRGMLSMANSGKDTNGSQFFITFKGCRHLDGKHVVFGHVDLGEEEEGEEGRKVLDMLEGMKVKKGSGNEPQCKILIADGGVIAASNENLKEKAEKEQPVKELKDDDEIDLDEDEDDDDDEDDDNDETDENKAPQQTSETPPPSQPTTKRSKLQERLRKLKLKMNQSKRLNHAEVLNEGDRLGSQDNIRRHAKRMSKEEKERIGQEFATVNSKALSVVVGAGAVGDDNERGSSKKKAGCMVQQASESIRLRHKSDEKAEQNRFEINDYYNPEGQLRNYERSLQSLGGVAGRKGNGQHYYNSTNDDNDTSTITGEGEEIDGRRITLHNERQEQKHLNQNHQNEREGARRMAQELQRRAAKAEKRKRDRKDVEFEGTDIGHINDRNERFNKKINRNYDRHTAEIRQNLERGTAL